MEKLVMKDTAMAEAPSEFVVQEMGELLEEVSAYDNTGNAIGYSVYYYASNMYERPELKFMAVDGVMPDRSSIREGATPLSMTFMRRFLLIFQRTTRPGSCTNGLPARTGRAL